MRAIGYLSGRDLYRLTGPKTPTAVIFHECVGEAKFGIKWLAPEIPLA